MNQLHEITTTFLKSFRTEKDKKTKIALYGIGNNTKILLEELKGFNIVCLMDAKNEGKILYGLPVVSMEQAACMADIVVIIARSSVVRIIYERIKGLEEKALSIYNVLGEKLGCWKAEEYVVDARLQQCSLNAVIEKINTHDVISFDIFDTLIMRRTAFPRDVFDLVERKLQESGIHIDNFSVIRIEAERIIETKKVAAFDEIYEEIKHSFSLDSYTAAQIKNMEIETELSLLAKRVQICNLIGYAKGIGKRVILVSDMYYGIDTMTSILEANGIQGYDYIYISCEYQERKRDSLFATVRKKEMGNILHIGDSDVDERGMDYGIDCFRIYSAMDMLEMSPVRDLAKFTGTVENNILIGALLCDIFNSPFYFSIRSNVLIKDSRPLAHALLGPLLTSFEDWLLYRIKEHGEDAYILFSSRDGYLFKRIYDVDDKQLTKPPGKYLFTSRVAAQGLCLTDMDVIMDALNKDYEGTLGQFFLDRFGYIPDRLNSEIGKKCIKNHSKEIRAYVLSCQEDFIEYADKNCHLFKEYMDNLCPDPDKRVFFVDFMAAGSVQHFLEEALQCRWEGLYFSQVYQEKDWNIEVQSYLGECHNYTPQFNMQKYHLLLEALILCPSGMCIGYDETDTYRFREDTRNGEHIETLLELHQQSINFFMWLRGICKGMDYRQSVSYIDYFFSLICEGRIELSEGMRHIFCMENYYDGQQEQDIFQLYGLRMDCIFPDNNFVMAKGVNGDENTDYWDKWFYWQKFKRKMDGEI